MLNDWGTRAVTLSSLLLRATASAQAVVCTSLVSALILEKRHVRISQLAHFSITRSVNNGPRQLIKNIFCSRSWALAARPESVLLVLLAFASLGIQFASTILLPSFSTASLAQASERTRHNIALSSRVDGDALSNAMSMSMGMSSSSRAAFGELEVSGSPEPNEYGVSDVMLTSRVFPPFASEDRLRLRSYKGVALAINTRVSCTRPSIKVTLETHVVDYDDPVRSISGEISYDRTFSDAKIDEPTVCSEVGPNVNVSVCLPRYFNCKIPSRELRTVANWQPALCVLPPSEVVDMEEIRFGADWNSVWTPTSMFFLAIATNANLSYYEQQRQSDLTDRLLESPEPIGEWLSYPLFDESFLNVSLCSASLNTTVVDVEMAASTDPQEPEFTWYPNGTSPSTKTLQTMMGADPTHVDARERGILAVRNIKQPAPLSSFSIDPGLALDTISTSEHVAWLGNANIIWSDATYNFSMGMCISCSLQSWSTLPDGAALFSAIINSVGRPAVAINSYLTLMMQSFYSYLVPLFDVSGDVEVVFSKQVSIPKYWDGLIAVLVMVSIELLCVAAIVWLYVTNIRYTRQGNYWHTVSQLVSNRTHFILKQSDELKDREVSRILNSDDSMVSVGRSTQTGKVSVLWLKDSQQGRIGGENSLVQESLRE